MKQSTSGNHQMPEQQCIDVILETNRPLMIARVALDTAYDKASREITVRRRAGEPLADMMHEDFAAETEAHTRSILATYGPERPDTGYHDWFMLRATLEAARPQRLLLFDAFSRKTAPEFRQMLKRDALRSHTTLLVEMFDTWGSVNPEERPELALAIDEVSLVAGLARSRRSDRAAVLSSIIGSKLFGTQARFKYFDGAEVNALTASLQARTRLNNRERADLNRLHSRQHQGTPRVTVEMMRLFGTTGAPRRVAHLLAKECAGSLKESEQRELERSVANIEEYIINNAETQRIPTPAVADAV